jgi:hypothetical protein
MLGIGDGGAVTHPVCGAVGGRRRLGGGETVGYGIGHRFGPRVQAVPVGPGWAGLLGPSLGRRAVFVSTVHFGPAAVEPPALILDHYQPPILGWLAFGWLIVFVTVLAITCVYETRLWGQHRQARRATEPATDAEVPR